MSEKLRNFYVDFYYGDDDELDDLMDENPDAEDEYIEAHTYRNEIALKGSEEEYYKCFDKNKDKVNHIETTYGILDGGGIRYDDGWDLGYSSYEIQLKDCDKVWQMLVDMLREANLLADCHNDQGY